MAVKLTDAERMILVVLEKGPEPGGKKYRPAQSLVAKGYARWLEGGHLAQPHLQITDEGRQALETYYEENKR
ncbi:MAG: hypothetical protein J0I99_00475 [Devosia sp.]|uniref:hypothetical protein n=1 Tax=Devosia sp. TaxID=1871048 RepID=UPI001AD35532|nr:hypothetical protein [Devosia sp.]MBN9310838.1 hypothetical protein [Devosia sp.]MBN9314191.1 hypothetical protein [Devosia sp.]